MKILDFSGKRDRCHNRHLHRYWEYRGRHTQNMKKGNTEPNLKLLIRLSELLDVSLDNLISEDLTHNDREIFRNEEIRFLP
jgi:hypothetical protein